MRYLSRLILALGLILFGGGCKDSAESTTPAMERPLFVSLTEAEVQAETVSLFLERDYTQLEARAEAARRDRTRLQDGSWVWEAQLEALTPKALTLERDEMAGRFDEWAASLPQSQLRAAYAAFYWRTTARGTKNQAERVALGRLRIEALDSVEDSALLPELAVEKLMRLTSREADREKAVAIYAASLSPSHGYGRLVEAYAGWLSGFAPAEVGPWLGAQADAVGGIDGDELYAWVAVSRPRSNVDWIEARGLDWSRIERGLWSWHRRWPGAVGVLDRLAKAALAKKDTEVLSRALEGMEKPHQKTWSDNYGYYLQTRRLAGLEKPSALEPIREVNPDENERLYSARFAPDGRSVAIGGAKGGLSIWSVPELERLWTVQNPHWISAIAYSPDGRWLAVSGGHFHDNTKGGNVRVWDVRTRTVAATLDNLPQVMHAVAFSPSSDILWAAGGNKTGQVARWKTDESKIEMLPEDEMPTGEITGLAVGEKGVYMAAWKRIWVVEWARNRWLSRVLHDGEFNYLSLTLNPDGSRLAAGTWKQNREWDSPAGIEIYNTASFRSPAVELPVRGTRVEEIVFTPDGHRLLAASNASEVRVWALPDDRQEFDFHADGWTIDALAVSPDSMRAVTLDTASVIRLWNLIPPKSTVEAKHAVERRAEMVEDKRL